MTKKSTFQPVSRARSAKNFRWNAKERFSTGHDYHCMSLVPHIESLAENSSVQTALKARIRVYRAKTFGMTAEQRVLEDAKVLVANNKADTVDDAVEMILAKKSSAND